ncbi:uncharacterized protein PG986_000883 [Apiospora aurea]|uniref:Nephrocystin 3-like N-terminal domain-containing protein n=1 Tax=Apiospora aurea TaxID=335848 RepID=A0ABR1QV99_9PEZI
MGGLIVKEAYMQGQNDPEILQSSMITNSKHYVLELAKNSPTLQKLNEQFRHIAPKLDIMSFYETEPTSIGMKNARGQMVLEKDTSVLGYPGEASKALIADHHGVCKYDSPADPNYITVRNVIKSLVSKILATNKSNVGTERHASISSRQDTYDLQSALAIPEMPETDYIFHRDLWTEETCEWVTQNASFVGWTDSTQTMTRILWHKGGPATGKSVMSSFIINTLVESGALCQYFFMRFGDPKKRSTSVLLRSLVYQLSRDVPRFSRQLEELIGEAIDLPSASPRLLWERIFKSLLFNLEGSKPIYWVIDGLDEADDPQGEARDLAEKIIGYVSCSLRKLTVSGLPQALDEDESDALGLQRSIAELCSGFVTIDNGGEVSLIHQTAREYLLNDISRPFHVNPKTAHERLFLSCMKCLRTNGLRANIARDQLPDFVCYASLHWSSHLLLAPIESEVVATELSRFMTGQSILTWIHIISRSKQLRVLVQTSKHISKYVAKVKTLHGSRDMKADFIMQQALLESWAVDLVKIMGKFGSNLTRRPDAIYKAIPPFCPRNSAIFQQFGKGETRSLSVKSHDDWDDSLTRISLGFGAYTSSIRTAGSLVAILATPGSVFIFNSGTFEEVSGSPFKHGERVYSMEIHASSATLVTYGYRTTKVWDTSSGGCRITIPNIESRPRPLTMVLTNHSKVLLVGFDDRHIRSLNLSGASPGWQVYAELEEPELEGHFLNSANFMATNGDGSLFAVAYRGHPLSAWETEGPAHLGHCWRKRDELARGEFIDAVWHPMSPEVLGVYIEGVVFKWLPYEDVVEEIQVGASKLAISSDGNIFVTGDVHGTVKVFGTSDLGLLYQLGSQDTVLGLAFSPDSRRFYDIRGCYASAWEPNVLIRMTEQADANLETASDSISLVPGVAHLLSCKDSGLKTYHFDLPDLSSETPTSWKDQQPKVERVMPSSDCRHLLVQLHLRKPMSERNCFLYFPLSAFSWTPAGGSSEAHPTRLVPLCFPSHISSDIALGLSFLPQNKLVYLSKNFAISTVRIAPGSDWSPAQTTTSLQTQKGTKTRTNPMTELFALPRDWISRGFLGLSVVWLKGKSFLCPRNGEVSVVRSSGLG